MPLYYKYFSSFSSAAKLQIHTVGFNGEITIKSAKNGKYLAMDSKGKVSLAVSFVMSPFLERTRSEVLIESSKCLQLIALYDCTIKQLVRL